MKLALSALPGGYRSSDGTFSSIGYSANWWSATEDYAEYVWAWYVV